MAFHIRRGFGKVQLFFFFHVFKHSTQDKRRLALFPVQLNKMSPAEGTELSYSSSSVVQGFTRSACVEVVALCVIKRWFLMRKLALHFGWWLGKASLLLQLQLDPLLPPPPLLVWLSRWVITRAPGWWCHSSHSYYSCTHCIITNCSSSWLKM